MGSNGIRSEDVAGVEFACLAGITPVRMVRRMAGHWVVYADVWVHATLADGRIVKGRKRVAVRSRQLGRKPHRPRAARATKGGGS